MCSEPPRDTRGLTAVPELFGEPLRADESAKLVAEHEVVILVSEPGEVTLEQLSLASALDLDPGDSRKPTSSPRRSAPRWTRRTRTETAPRLSAPEPRTPHASSRPSSSRPSTREMPIRMCAEPRCPNVATARGRCDQHRKQLERERSARRRTGDRTAAAIRTYHSAEVDQHPRRHPHPRPDLQGLRQPTLRTGRPHHTPEPRRRRVRAHQPQRHLRACHEIKSAGDSIAARGGTSMTPIKAPGTTGEARRREDRSEPTPSRERTGR